MWWRALLVGGLFAGLLGACAVVDPVDSRFDTVTRSLARARDEAIFLNLIRASQNYPLAVCDYRQRDADDDEYDIVGSAVFP